MNRVKSFQSALELLPGKLGWTIARVPFDPVTVWPERNRMRVKGTISDYAFRTSLFVDDAGHFLLVNKQMQKGANVGLGGRAVFLLEPDLDERKALVPEELSVIFQQHKRLRKFYEELSESTRTDIYKHVTAPRSAESRVNRAEQFAERIMLTMEAERVLPPSLTLAFRNEPRAREGWLAMTALQRRGHLLGIFGYQGPKSRAKRTAKAVEEAREIARRRSGKKEVDQD